jgi:hypothetical protein
MTKQMYKQTLQTMHVPKKHRSVALHASELQWLKDFVSNCPTQTVALEQLGLRNRGTLANILKGGSGSHDNIEIIRGKINPRPLKGGAI